MRSSSTKGDHPLHTTVVPKPHPQAGHAPPPAPQHGDPNRDVHNHTVGAIRIHIDNKDPKETARQVGMVLDQHVGNLRSLQNGSSDSPTHRAPPASSRRPPPKYGATQKTARGRDRRGDSRDPHAPVEQRLRSVRPRRTDPASLPFVPFRKAPTHVSHTSAAIVRERFRERLRLMPLGVFAEGIDRLRSGNGTRKPQTGQEIAPRARSRCNG
jgi:hypothetical protein